MSETLVFTMEVPVYPERVYRAWLDSYEHSQFTGKPARIDAQVGGKIQTMDGQVQGVIQSLSPHDRIVHAWQVEGFSFKDAGALELLFEPTCTGTELKLRYSGVTSGKSQEMLRWWETTYLRPMRAYFDALVGEYVADMGDG
jgi:uncharacterized protein YndB with AHSA1/START domain